VWSTFLNQSSINFAGRFLCIRINEKTPLAEPFLSEFRCQGQIIKNCFIKQWFFWFINQLREL